MQYWMARDKSGNLFVYDTRPQKGKEVWFTQDGMVCPLPPSWFPNVKWTDERAHKLILQETVWNNINTNIQI